MMQGSIAFLKPGTWGGNEKIGEEFWNQEKKLVRRKERYENKGNYGKQRVKGLPVSVDM